MCIRDSPTTKETEKRGNRCKKENGGKERKRVCRTNVKLLPTPAMEKGSCVKMHPNAFGAWRASPNSPRAFADLKGERGGERRG